MPTKKVNAMPIARPRKKSGKKIQINPNEPVLQMITRFLAIFLATLLEHWLDRK